MSSTATTLQPVDDITDYNLHNVWFLLGETHTGIENLGDTFSDWMIPVLHYSLATITIPFFEQPSIWHLFVNVGACVCMECVSGVFSQMQVCTFVIYVVCDNKP